MIPAARQEMIKASSWYQSKSAGLGDQFLDEIGAALLLAREFPYAYPEIDRPYRRMLVNRFPYGLIYRVDPDEIVVIAVANLKRRPRYWRRRKAAP